ncbi:sugar phosphate isomerase/epimerase family protein [Saccharibacillus endophyticus]|uniref:Sugar phosphate isomerase n=1 Tax=Saccharibacillus endophyticus TaxID=2060666 RepID=A0ABQ1ZL44_9BACL|nr:sugar phosphate isomerase/epimerase [Saccharibacillus endophyticus]GGH67768.1 sugar phosphate isomerase [Saccharibacillus endophyticus]
MLKGLTRAGLGSIENDEQFLKLASDAGFDSVDLNARALIEQYGEKGAIELFQRYNLQLGSIDLPVEWRADEEAFLAGLPALTEAAAAARKLGCTRCCTYVLPSTDQMSAHFMALATRRLRICAQILGAYGIRLGLEFVGPHHLRTAWKYPFIWTMQDTLDWIDAIGEPNVGLLLDAYHWHTNNLTVTDLERLQPHQIVHVHLNDAKDLPVDQILDNDRIYPGEGIIDLPGFLRALNQIGYTDFVTQEILTPSAPKESPEKLVQRSKKGYDQVFSAAGL